MSERDTAAFLAAVPLLQGMPVPDVAELARVMRRRRLPAGEILWHEGAEAKGMAVIVDGQVAVTKRLPGERTVEVAELGPGEALGEIPLIDGGLHSSTARVTEPTTVLLLGRPDFVALASRRHPSAFALKRRLAAVAAERVRSQVGSLAAMLGGEAGSEPAADAEQTLAELEWCSAPDSSYVRRMATFRAFDALALWGFLTAGQYARCPRGRTLVAEGTAASACFLTINGAVEKVLIRGNRRLRVGLAGPGQAFGYEGLIDGGRSPLTAITRERTLMLVLAPDSFQRLFHGDTDVSQVFLDVINRNLTASLRQALHPQARLAVGV